MRIDYLIDGYNFLHAHMGAVRPGPGNLERARQAMLAFIANRVASPQTVTVVFDAPTRGRSTAPENRDCQGMRVMFAYGFPNADALIGELCRNHHFPKQLWVVSDDREVQAMARRRKAIPVSCARFSRELTRSALADPSGQEAEAEKNVTFSDDDISHWLEVFNQPKPHGPSPPRPKRGDRPRR